jgi:hypothetical protein
MFMHAAWICLRLGGSGIHPWFATHGKVLMVAISGESEHD